MQVGIIEGFFGEPWSWSDREACMSFLSEQGGGFYLYAPKADSHLRKKWREPHSAADRLALQSLQQQCRECNVHFGIGLTPYALHEQWDAEGRLAWKERLEGLRDLKLDVLAVLFDDMPGDFPNLARTQAEIVQVAVDVGIASTILMCPTYYTDPGILDRLFGQRPDNYLSELGAALDPDVGVFWTGPYVVSSNYPAEHLVSVTERLGRKPFIWDNYPVNDGPKMSRFLHLRAPKRPEVILEHVQGLAINPMNQPWLSRIPMLAALQTLHGKSAVDVDAQTEQCIHAVLPEPLAQLLVRDWQQFHDVGLDEIPDEVKAALSAEYQAHEHPAAREVCRWLNEGYAVSADIITDV